MYPTPRICLTFVVVLALLWTLPARAGGRIYSYVDEDGVTHYSNNPSDSRYAPVVLKKPWQERAAHIPNNWGFDGLILLNAREHSVPPALVKAVIAAESAFNPSAVSQKGAQGLMQLMPATAASLGVTDALLPSENVRGGVRYLRRMLDRFGDMPRALAAYNAGPTAVDRYRGVPPYRETRDYVKRVLEYYRHYHGDFR